MGKVAESPGPRNNGGYQVAFWRPALERSLGTLPALCSGLPRTLPRTLPPTLGRPGPCLPHWAVRGERVPVQMLAQLCLRPRAVSPPSCSTPGARGDTELLHILAPGVRSRTDPSLNSLS